MSSRLAAYNDGTIYVNGSRLSSSLLELQPFQVPEEGSRKRKSMDAGKYSQNNNNHYKDRRTNSTPSYDGDADSDNAKLTLLSANSNQSPTSASCGNLLESPSLRVKSKTDALKRNESTGNRATSAHFNSRGQDNNHPLTRSTSKDRLLVNENLRSPQSGETKKTPPVKPNRESIRRSKQDIRHAPVQSTPTQQTTVDVPDANGRSRPAHLPYHDYEELPSDVKTNQSVLNPLESSPNNLQQEVGFTPIAFQSATTPAVPERQKHPRQKQNPLYAGMHVNPYDACTANIEMPEQRPSARCLHCLTFFVITALLISILSISVTALFILGYLPPLKDFSKSNESIQADKAILTSQNETITRLQAEVEYLSKTTNESNFRSEKRLELIKSELIEAVKNLNLTALKGPSTADVSRCVHRDLGIGSSSTLNELESGVYFAEEGYVTTGVSCSAPIGYVASLHSREEEGEWSDVNSEQLPRVHYWCTCRKLTSARTGLTNTRVKCTLHYWQCPVL